MSTVRNISPAALFVIVFTESVGISAIRRHNNLLHVRLNGPSAEGLRIVTVTFDSANDASATINYLQKLDMVCQFDGKSVTAEG